MNKIVSLFIALFITFAVAATLLPLSALAQSEGSQEDVNEGIEYPPITDYSPLEPEMEPPTHVEEGPTIFPDEEDQARATDDSAIISEVSEKNTSAVQPRLPIENTTIQEDEKIEQPNSNAKEVIEALYLLDVDLGEAQTQPVIQGAINKLINFLL